jgi:hypothetical protein
MARIGIMSGGAKGLLGDKYKKLLAKRQGEVTRAYKAALKDVFTDLVKGTPQWSGNLASNWYIVTSNMASPRHRKVAVRVGNRVPWEIIPMAIGKRLKRGDNPAVADTLSRELPVLANIKYNSKVVFVNTAPYASEVEAKKGPGGRDIRPQNLSETGAILMVTYVKMKYQMKGLNLV